MKKFLPILICFFIVNFSIFASQTNSLNLRIIDQNGSLVGNVEAVLIFESNPVKKISTTEPKEFIFNNLKTGKFIILITAVGFKPFSKEIEIANGKNNLQISLEIAEIVENVEIQKEVKEKAVEDVFSNFLTNEQIALLSDDPQEMEKQLRQMAGDRNVVIRVDGFSSSKLPPKNRISSIRIVRSSFDAENHELGFSYVDIVTKAGNNRWTGTAAINLTDAFLNARNPLSNVRLPEKIGFGMFFLDGTLIKNKTSVSLLAMENVTAKKPNIIAVFPNSNFVSNVLTNTGYGTFIDFNILHNFTKQHSGRFSYKMNLDEAKNIGVGEFNLNERAYSANSREQQFRFSESGNVGKYYHNEMRMEVTQKNNQITPNSKNVTIIVPDTFIVGGAGNENKNNKLSVWFADNFLFGVKNHALKIGGLLHFERKNEANYSNQNGTFYFASLADFSANKPSLFTQFPDVRETNVSQLKLGAFFQDDIRINRALMINLGLRYEKQSYLKDNNNFSPRFGFSLIPVKSGKIAIRGGFGLYYDWLNIEQISIIQGKGRNQPTEIFIENPVYPVPVGGYSNILQNYWILDEHAVNPYILHSSIGTEINFKNANFRINYLYQKGLHLFRGRNINAPLFGLNPNPEFGVITKIESSGVFINNELSLSFGGSLKKCVSYNVNYYLSKKTSDNEGIFSLPVNSYILRNEYSYANDDQRHRLNSSISINIIKGIRFSGIYRLNSPLPFNITTGKDENGDGFFNDRPLGVQRNSERGDWNSQFDASLSWIFSFADRKARNENQSFSYVMNSTESASGFDFTDPKKKFSIKLYATAQNIFNQTNIQNYVGVQTSPLFRQPVSANSARRINLGLRFNF